MNHKTKSNLNQVLIQLPQIEKTLKQKTKKDQIINYLITTNKPLRTCEIAKALDMKNTTVCRTVRELLNDGYILQPGRTELSIIDLDKKGKPKHSIPSYPSAYLTTRNLIQNYIKDYLN